MGLLEGTRKLKLVVEDELQLNGEGIAQRDMIKGSGTKVAVVQSDESFVVMNTKSGSIFLHSFFL